MCLLMITLTLVQFLILTVIKKNDKEKFDKAVMEWNQGITKSAIDDEVNILGNKCKALLSTYPFQQKICVTETHDKRRKSSTGSCCSNVLDQFSKVMFPILFVLMNVFYFVFDPTDNYHPSTSIDKQVFIE